MKTPFTITVLFSLVAAIPVQSEEAKSAPAFVLKNRSEFTSQAVKRDPFWPIGWVKPEQGPAAASLEEGDFRVENFKLTSVLLGSPALAVINGKEFAEGEAGFVKVGLQKINVTILNIMDGAVRLQHRGKTIVVELKRK